MLSPQYQAASKASAKAKAASKAKAGRWEIRKRGPLGASGSTTWFTRESQRAHGDISFHSTKSTQGLTGSKRTNLSAFSNIPVGHCSCEVPKRKKEKIWMRKMRLRLGRFFLLHWQESVQRLLHGVKTQFFGTHFFESQ